MSKLLAALTIALLTATNSFAQSADFEDIEQLQIPTAPFSTGGLGFTSTAGQNAVFPAGESSADNGTQVFGWCGSGCGETQVISAAPLFAVLFQLESIDVGNLAPSNTGLGWAPGMTVEILGFQADGGTVSESLEVFEDVFTTYSLTGFTNLTRVEFTAPTVSLGGGGFATPDPVIDNINFSTVPVPEPTSAPLLAIGLLGLVCRLRHTV